MPKHVLLVKDVLFGISTIADYIRGSNPKKPPQNRFGQRGREGVTWPIFLEFSVPIYITGMVKDRNFKFGMHIDHQGF